MTKKRIFQLSQGNQNQLGIPADLDGISTLDIIDHTIIIDQRKIFKLHL